MAIRKDSFFSFSRGERRATIALIAILLLIVALRVGLHLYQSSGTKTDSAEYAPLLPELEEFDRSLRTPQDKESLKKGDTGKKARRSTQEPRTPKELKPVPREE